MKLDNDKYYTPIDLAKKCIDTAYDIIGLDNISDIIEPSAGNGSFSSQIDCIAYDISPEGCSIQQANFLTLDIEYKPGRLIIGNPPYGRCLNMAQKFYKKAVSICDFIAFILPISQLNNTQSLYQFDLIHSEDIGEWIYTDRKLHCCYNIYARPKSGLNKRASTTLSDISIYRQDSTEYKKRRCDLRMCYWGDGTAGKILSDDEHYSAEYKIEIHNEMLRDSIISTLSTFDWKAYLKCIAMRKIQQYHIIKVLSENIEGIK